MIISSNTYSQNEYIINWNKIVKSETENTNFGRAFKYINLYSKTECNHNMTLIVRDNQVKALFEFFELSGKSDDRYFDIFEKSRKKWLRSDDEYDCDWIMALYTVKKEITKEIKNLNNIIL